MTVRPAQLVIAIALVATAATAGRARGQGPGQTAPPSPDVRGYVYVEPFDLRTELVARLAGLERPDVLAGAVTALDRAAQQAVLDALRVEVAGACTLRVDGAAVTLTPEELRFIVIDPELGPLPDERERIPLDEATLAAVFAQARTGIPEQIEITWSLFPVGGAGVPVVAEVMSGRSIESETLHFTPEERTRRWTLPEVDRASALVAVAPVGDERRLTPYVVAGVFIVIALGLAARAIGKRAAERPGALVAALIPLALGIGAFVGMPGAGSGRMDEDEARGIVDALLANVYHAFSYRDESTIFDTLAASVDGPLLEELYLDIRRGLVVDDADGPRVKVLDVALLDCEVQRAPGGTGLLARALWVSAGTVSHWGHVHERRNQYRGELRIEPVDGRWKVTDVTILEEERT